MNGSVLFVSLFLHFCLQQWREKRKRVEDDYKSSGNRAVNFQHANISTVVIYNYPVPQLQHTEQQQPVVQVPQNQQLLLEQKQTDADQSEQQQQPLKQIQQNVQLLENVETHKRVTVVRARVIK